MAIFASFVHCLPNILHICPHDSFQVIRLSMTSGIFQGHWTVSHQISQKTVCDTAKVTLLIRNHTLCFRLVPLLMTLIMSLKYIWRSFQPRLSFPRPFQQSLACFRDARSPSNLAVLLVTARCYAERGIAMASFLFVRPSDCLTCTVTLRYHGHGLEFLENNFTAKMG